MVGRLTMAALASLLLVLGACAATDVPGGRASKDFQFDTNSATGVVIVGIRNIEDINGDGLFGDINQNWNVIWSRFDPTSLFFHVPYENVRGYRLGCGLEDFALGCNEDHSQVQYLALVATPGHYALREVVLGLSHTIYASNGGSLIASNSLRQLLPAKRIPWFSIEAGEIIYIGDYVFDTKESPVKLVSIERSDEDVKQVRHKIPGLQGEIKYRGGTIRKKDEVQETDEQPSDEET